MNFLKKISVLLLSLLLIFIIYLLFWPIPMNPVPWTPTAALPLTGELEPNHELSVIERIELIDGSAPEDVAVDTLGRIYGGLKDGRIVRLNPDGSGEQVFAQTQGRPLGLHFDRHGNLIVADAQRGLLSIDANGIISVLATEANGAPFRLTDDVDIANNGVIYFSDASYKFSFKELNLDALEHQPNGRLISYNPRTHKTTVLLDSLYFANGIALSLDQTFVLVNETWKYRVTRYWISGDKQGQSDTFIDHLPGFPDGISGNSKGGFWLALVSPRNPILEAMAAQTFLRKVVARLPAFLQPGPTRYAFVVGLDVTGKVIHNLQEPSGKPFSLISSVQEHKGTLYFGSIEESAIGLMPAP